MVVEQPWRLKNICRMKCVKLLIISVLALAVGCRSYYDRLLAGSDVDEKFKAGLDYYNKGKFRKSAPLFESIVLATQGTPQEDSVQYYSAMSNYKMGDYVTAEQNFTKFLEVFPRSPFTEESKFLKIKCLYEGTYRWELDQVPTRKAISFITEFMYDNPDSQYRPICQAMLDEFNERLDRKEYEAAKLYFKMEDYQAAHYALKGVLKDNSENRYREQILYYTALSSYNYALLSVKQMQKERYLTFIDDYYNFIGEYPAAKERVALDNCFVKAQKSVGNKVDRDTLQNPIEQGVTPKTASQIKADRKATKQAIKEAKKAVAVAESENEVARSVMQDKEKAEAKRLLKKKRKQEK